VHLKDLVKLESMLHDEQTASQVLSMGAGAALNGVNGATVVDGAAPAGEMVNLMPVVREAARVPETITIDKLLAEFKRRGQRMAIVIDEYGGTAGLVTMGDLLEQVFGDVRDEFDRGDPEIQELPDGTVRLHGRVLIDEVNERYGLGLNAEEADTMAGLVLSALGRPAVVGDQVDVHGTQLRVLQVDRLRIAVLLLQLPPRETAERAAEEAERARG
jgi:CBS domain containing-hemolysin-like protein